MTLVLASRSPRRFDILREMGCTFVVDSADIDETPLAGESPRDLVQRLAVAKCVHVAARHEHDVVVLAADTTVDLDGEIFGTPRDTDHAREMLRRLSGRTHQVHTAVCVRSSAGLQSALDTAQVTMGVISPRDLEAYLATGEPMDKAGAYALQGGAGAFVERVDGHSSTVIGLPTPLVRGLLAPLGLLPGATRP